ncbi:MAG: TIGR00730 family Rossman fold protein [bacterium]
MNTICVYCGSSPGARPDYRAEAENLGQLLARRKIGLVYGGSNVGIMGMLADSVLASGGHVTGVIPKFLVDKEVAHPALSDQRIVDSMHERKMLMADLADGFIALPGGLGTLEEFFEALAWSQLGLHRKPCGLLNVTDYFTHLIRFLDHAVEQRFLAQAHRAMVLVAEGAETLLQKLISYQPPLIEKWLDRE